MKLSHWVVLPLIAGLSLYGVACTDSTELNETEPSEDINEEPVEPEGVEEEPEETYEEPEGEEEVE